MKKIESSVRLLDKSLELFALFCLTVSVLLAVFNVAMRYFFDTSFGVIEEICRYSIIYGVFAYLGPLIKKDEHIKVDFLQSKLSGKVKDVNNLIISIVLLGAFTFLCWTSIQWVNSLYQMKLMSNSGSISMVIPTITVPIGMFLGCFYSVLQILTDVHNIFTAKDTRQEQLEVANEVARANVE